MSRTYGWFLIIVILVSFLTECGSSVAKRKKRPGFRKSKTSAKARFNTNDIDPDQAIAELPKDLTYVNHTYELCKICKDCKSCNEDSEFRAPVFPEDYLVFTSVKGKHSEQAVRDYISNTFPGDLKRLNMLPYKVSMVKCGINASITNERLHACNCKSSNTTRATNFSLELHHIDKIFNDVKFCSCDRDGICDVYVNTRTRSPLTYKSLDEDDPKEITYTRGVESKIKFRYKVVDSASGKETFYAVSRKSLNELVESHSRMLQNLDFDLIMATDLLADWIVDRVEYCYIYGIKRSEQGEFQEYIDWLRSMDWA